MASRCLSRRVVYSTSFKSRFLRSARSPKLRIIPKNLQVQLRISAANLLSRCADHTSLDAAQSRLVLIVGQCKKTWLKYWPFPFVVILASVRWTFVQKAFANSHIAAMSLCFALQTLQARRHGCVLCKCLQKKYEKCI